MCAKSSTGRTQPSRREISTTSSTEPSSRTRPITSIPNGTARSFRSAARGARRAARRPSRSPPRACGRAGSRGGRRRARRPAAFAIPAEWSSMPTAMFSFLPRSAWPMKPAIGACTESTMSSLARELAERGRRSRSPSRSGPRSRSRTRCSRARAARRSRLSGLSCDGTRAGPKCSGRSPSTAEPSRRPSDAVSTLGACPRRSVAHRPARARHRPAARRPLARGRRDRASGRSRSSPRSCARPTARATATRSPRSAPGSLCADHGYRVPDRGATAARRRLSAPGAQAARGLNEP